MDNNNWRPNPSQGPVVGGGGGGVGAPPGGSGGEAAMDFVDWRSQLKPDSRLRIINKIMETLKRHLPVSGQEGLHELRKIAIRFEENIYTAATSQSDYLRKISLKMLTMEANSQNPIGNALPSNSAGNSNKSPDAGKHKKVRKREAGEPINTFRGSKKGTARKCGNCFQWGHNQRTCKAPDNPNKKAYKKKKKRVLSNQI